MIRNAIERIRRLWGVHDDFDQGGFEYVAFIIENDLADMRESGYDDEQCTKELADTAINALRAIDELGTKPPDVAIHDRMDDRMDGQTEAIIEKYQRRYAERRS